LPPFCLPEIGRPGKSALKTVFDRHTLNIYCIFIALFDRIGIIMGKYALPIDMNETAGWTATLRMGTAQHQ